MTHIHVNKELTDDLEYQGYHLVDKHQLAKMQQLEKVAQIVKKWVKHTPFFIGNVERESRDAITALEQLK